MYKRVLLDAVGACCCCFVPKGEVATRDDDADGGLNEAGAKASTEGPIKSMETTRAENLVMMEW